MSRQFYVVAGIFAALCITGYLDHQAAKVAHESAMEAPRPIFEPANEILPLHMPCTYIQAKRFEHEPVSSRNTRCTNAERSED